MTTLDRAALLVSLLAVLAGVLIAGSVYQHLPHLEDEFAYLWQAKVIARGDLTVPSPEFSKSFLVPFVVDYQGLRFGKYPLGWPVVLSFGIRVNGEHWVNPVLGGLAVWLTYRLAKRYFGARVGLLAGILMGSAPIFLIQVGSLLSHSWSLVLSLTFMLSWLDSVSTSADPTDKPLWLPTSLAGLSLGLLSLTRPLTMVGFAVPFGIHGLIVLFSGNKKRRMRILIIGGIAGGLSLLHFVWQWAVTGSFFLNPYTLWWPYDKLGFGKGVGVLDGGHTLRQAWWNTKHSLRAGLSDLFGWAMYSWIFLPFGLWAARKNKLTSLLVGIFFSLVILHMAYWVGSWLLGPRYYFESLPGLAILTAAGIAWLAGWPLSDQRIPDFQGWQRVRSLATLSIVALLLFSNVYFYSPARLGSLRGLYSIKKADLQPFTSPAAEKFTPALVIVHSEQWMPYGSLLPLSSPYLDSPWLFAWNISPQTDQQLVEAYQTERSIYHYYPLRSFGKLYPTPLPD